MIESDLGCKKILLDVGEVRKPGEDMKRDSGGLGHYDGGSGLEGCVENKWTDFACGWDVGFRQGELEMTPEFSTCPTACW